MAGENESILAAARQLAEAKFAIDTALAAVVAQLPDDERAEFEDADVEGFQFGGQFDRNSLSSLASLAKLPGGSRAFFDTNGVCGAQPGALGTKSLPGV